MSSLTLRPHFLKVAAVGLVFFGGFLAQTSYAAEKKTSFEPFVPYHNEFASAIVITPTKHEVLYSFKPHLPWVPASLTKLANALAFVRTKPKWGQIVSMKAADEVGGGRLRVAVGTKISVKDLFYSSITASANNAATALARVSGLGTRGFLQRMNKEARAVGATRSNFLDASGMNEKSQTSAYDMALIAEAAFRDPLIKSAATAMLYDLKLPGQSTRRTIKNTNKLLTDDPDVWVVGGKTGYLEESKYNLVVQVRPMTPDGKPVYGKDVIVVVLGSPTKDASFDTAKRLAIWAWHYHDF